MFELGLNNSYVLLTKAVYCLRSASISPAAIHHTSYSYA